MKNTMLIPLIITITHFSIPIDAAYVPKHQTKAVLKLARHIPNPRYSNVSRQQHRLIKVLRKCAPLHSNMQPNMFSMVIGALAYRNTIPLLGQNEPLIQGSISLFYNTSGYFRLIQKLINTATANDEKQFNGLLYELETAIAVQESGTENVVEFGKNASADGVTREIDVVTDTRWIECKAWNTWPKDKLVSLQRQVADQQKIAESYNKEHKTNLRFQVSFQSPIPEHLQRWFAQKGIEYNLSSK